MAFCFLLNQLLARESSARERLQRHAGQSAELRPPLLPPLRLVVGAGGRIEPASIDWSGEPSAIVTLEGVMGEGALADELRFLQKNLRWDFEEELSRVMGDVAAERVGGTLRAFARWQADAVQRLTETLRRLRDGGKRLPSCAAASSRASPPTSRGCALRSTGWSAALFRLLRLVRIFAIMAALRAARVHAGHARRFICGCSPAAAPIRAASGCARRSSAGPDLRQVRPGALDAPRPAAARHRRRAREAAGPRAAVPARARDRDDRARLRAAASATSSRRFERDAGRERLDRAGAFRHAARTAREVAVKVLRPGRRA